MIKCILFQTYVPEKIYIQVIRILPHSAIKFFKNGALEDEISRCLNLTFLYVI